MNRHAKIAVLKAISYGHISRDEAKTLILSNGSIVLNLSNIGGDEMNEIINDHPRQDASYKAIFQKSHFNRRRNKAMKETKNFRTTVLKSPPLRYNIKG
jgi:hypothetical protein